MFDLVTTEGGGRHAYDEDAALTPIFHALTKSGWRSRHHEPAARHALDSVDAFHSDPLTAPIPVQTVAPTLGANRRRRRASGAHALEP